MEQQEKLYYLKHGALWVAARGLTTQCQYAKLYSLAEAKATKKHFDKNKFIVEIVEVDND